MRADTHPDPVVCSRTLCAAEVGLVCSGDNAQDQASMQNLIQSVLETAAKANVTSLAMPLLGSGLPGWPAAVTAKAHIAQVLAAAHSGLANTSIKVMRLPSVCQSILV